MKKLMILSAMFLLASCSKTAIEEVTIGTTDYEFTAYAPDGQADARTYVDEQMKLHWTKNDLITIFHGMLEPLKFGFRGDTGATSGTYYNVDGIFYAPDQSAPNNVAVYPYSADHLLDENTRAVTLTMPAEQTYVENSFGLGANTMIAVTSEVNDLALYFKNVGTYLDVRLWGENQTVKSITVTATGGEALSGKATVTPTYGGDPSCVMANTGTAPSVKLVCEEAVTVNTTEDAPVSFWIVLPPVTMASGFNVMVENADGEKQVFTIDKSVTFKRNKYNTLTRELTAGVMANNQIWYTSSDDTMIEPAATGESVFGATISSHTYSNGLGVITFSSDVTKVGISAFKAKTKLATISLPETVTQIGSYAFSGCSSLQHIDIPTGVLSIQMHAFYGCSSVKRVNIPSTVTTIGSQAFLGCSGILSIDCNIPDATYSPYSPSSTLEGPFHRANFSKIIIGTGVTKIGNASFFRNSNLVEVIGGENVVSIGNYAFYGCGLLGNCEPLSATLTIGREAFRVCENLSELGLSESLETILYGAFWGCSSLTNVVIPQNIKTIGGYAFYDCDAMQSVKLMPITPPSGSSNMFDSGVTIYVPQSALDTYKTTSYWSTYKSAMVAF